MYPNKFRLPPRPRPMGLKIVDNYVHLMFIVNVTACSGRGRFGYMHAGHYSQINWAIKEAAQISRTDPDLAEDRSALAELTEINMKFA